MSYLVRPVSPFALRLVKHCARGKEWETFSSFSDRPVIPENIGEKQVWREKPTRCPENRYGAQAPWCPFLNFLKSIKYFQKKYLRVDNKTHYHSTNFY
jgi:hypothetical protein